MRSRRTISLLAAFGLVAAIVPASTAAVAVSQVVQVTFISTLCPSYTVVPANATPSAFDQTGGHFAELDTSYQKFLTNPATDIPGICTKAGGWQFQLWSNPGVSVKVGSPLTTLSSGAGLGTLTVTLDATELALAKTTGAPTGLWITQITKPSVAGFGALRCYNDIHNGDDRENIQGIGTASLHIYCISYSALPPTTYHALDPARLLDTRTGKGGIAGPVPANTAKTFHVTGGVVPANATAVTGNLTVTNQTAKGFLFIGPVPTNAPGSSTLNFPVGDNRANAVTVGLGAGGTLSFTYAAHAGNKTDVVFDVTGYFTPGVTGDTYHPLDPARLLDTRTGKGGITGPVPSHSAKTFTVIGGVVPSTATAVTGNLTVTNQTSKGFLFIGPVASNSPGSSTLNFPVHDNRANAVTVGLGLGGTLSFTFAGTAGANTDVIFDVTGYFTHDLTGTFYVPLSPARLLDTRISTGGVTGPVPSHTARTFAVINHGRVSSLAKAVTGNLTVTNQTTKGFLFIGPVASNSPTSSTLNFPVHDNRANAVTVGLGAGGTLSFTYVAPAGARTDAIFDVTGYFTP